MKESHIFLLNRIGAIADNLVSIHIYITDSKTCLYFKPNQFQFLKIALISNSLSKFKVVNNCRKSRLEVVEYVDM